MRTKLAAILAIVSAVVAAVACGSVKSTKASFGITTGSYTVDSSTSGVDDCLMNLDPTGDSFDVYDRGFGSYSIDVPVDYGTTIPVFFTRTKNAFSSPDTVTTAHFQPIRYIGGGGAFCTATRTMKISAVATSADSIAVDVRFDYAAAAGPDCALAPVSIPCTSEATFHMVHTSTPAAAAPTPLPTPEAVTGTIFATPESAAPLVDYYVSSSYGSMTFGGTLNGNMLSFSGQRWYCYGQVAGGNYVHNFGALADASGPPDQNFYLTVTSSMWSAGNKSADPDHSIYVELITTSNGLPVYDVIGSTGTVALTTAGGVVDASGSRCNFSISGMTIGGFKFPSAPPFAPHRANDPKALREIDWPSAR